MSTKQELLYLPHIDSQAGDLYALVFVVLTLMSTFVSIKYAIYAFIPVLMLNIISAPPKDRNVLNIINFAYVTGIVMALVKLVIYK